MSPDNAPLLTSLLEQVSRSFYKTLWILPRSVRSQISLAYLMARASDTIADTELVPAAQRREALHQFAERIEGRRSSPMELGTLASHQASTAERVLLERAEELCALLEKMEDADQMRIRTVLKIIISGQDLDLERFTGASRDNVVALQSDAELDNYTYRVAGCVGEFWTAICEAHVFASPAGLAPGEFRTWGVRFGKGLQLVNILRDLPEDLRKGRCYVPASALAGAGMKPADLLDASNEPRFRKLYQTYLDLARDHLRAGWHYTSQIPLRAARVRLACAWPILIGVKTLSLLRSGNVLNAGRRIKVSRAQVKDILVRSVVLLPVTGSWERLFVRCGGG